MKRYAALLRGVNVGGHNKLPMKDLRALFEELGYTDVATYIQSGNVVFSAQKAVKAQTIEQAIADRFKMEPAVILRTDTEMRKALDNNPFPDADSASLHIGFMVTKPPAATVKALDLERFAPDEVAVVGADVYFHLPNGLGRSKLPPYVDARLKEPITRRNWATVTKLVEMVSQSSA